ncbi:MAG: hypothetical protein IPP72_06785 [Chitinophagaceae bacterium]|nr:hypothetical protein [Chitinophagaceae bacterium]
MKCIACFLLTMLLCASAFCTTLQPAQQNQKSKVENTDGKAAKNAQPKVQPGAAAQDSSKNKTKKEATTDDADFLGPLSWRPGLLY